jgi:hypothetical protein
MTPCSENTGPEIYSMRISRLCACKTTTYHIAGQSVVQIAEKDGAEKRYATLQLTVRLDGDPENHVPQPKPMIMFRGHQGKRISAQEKNSWDGRVEVVFQTKDQGMDGWASFSGIHQACNGSVYDG